MYRDGEKIVTLEMYDQISGCWYEDHHDVGTKEGAQAQIAKYRKLGSEGIYRIVETTYVVPPS